MMRWISGFTLLATTSGCVVYDTGAPPVGPTITYADAGCYPDDNYRDFVWYFEADVADGNGGVTVVQVYADVFDDVSGRWVDGFDLYPEQGLTWSSAWVGGSTWLDCQYPYYSVDLTAETANGLMDVVTVFPRAW